MRVRGHSCVMTVAGSDSGGNAGVQADLRAFHCYGLHGCTVFAALTAQNPNAVRAVLPVPAEFVAQQLDAVFEAYPVAALKTGMLSAPDAIEAVADRLAAHPSVVKVVDPVMVATSGAKLASDAAVEALRVRLLPLADVVTPNIPEAESLCGISIASRGAMADAARTIFDRFGCAALVKGGHAIAGGTALAEDVLFDGVRISWHSMPVVANPASTHGTGCSLAAALVCELALGAPLEDAVAGAKKFVYEAIRLSYHIGDNCSVLGMPERK